MSQRLIDAEKLKKHYAWWEDDERRNLFDQIVDVQPTVDAVTVKHGKWRFVNCATGFRCQCSECLHWVDAGTDRNYCPNCGARMDEERKEE